MSGEALAIPRSLELVARPRRAAALAALVVLALTAVAYAALSAPTTTHGKSAFARAYGHLPLSFTPNRGQADTRARFIASGAGYGLFFTSHGPELALARQPKGHGFSTHPTSPAAQATLGMRLLGARRNPQIIGLSKLPGTVNSLIGNNHANWHTGIPTYSRIRYQNSWPGISVDFYGNQTQLEYTFQIAPGADPSQIRLGLQGARAIRLDGRGALLISLRGGSIREHAPYAYQLIGGRRQAVQSQFTLLGHDRVGLSLGAYDHSRPLTIDPTLAYSTYLGGSGDDFGQWIAVDSSGDAYISGSSRSTNFPTQNPLQAANHGGLGDVFVTKLDAAGTTVLYSTYLGGSGDDLGYGIAVDAAGDAYVTGDTNSTDFPTQNALQATKGGGTDGFVAKLNAAGNALVYSTYLGGSGTEHANGIAVDTSGSAYVAGYTDSTNFPTQNPLQAANGGGTDAFVTKLNPAGSALSYSTYLGGSSGDYGTGIAVDSGGNAYVTGQTTSTNFPTQNPLQAANSGGSGDAFVTKLNAAGSALTYSTYLGGSGSDISYGIAIDSTGNAYVTGQTLSANFPTQNPLQAANSGGSGDAFVTKLNAAGSALSYSTYLGGSGGDFGTGIAVDSSGSAYVLGQTTSTNFPTQSPLQAANGGGTDAFVTKLNAGGSALTYSTYLGGSGADLPGNGIAVDSSGAAYITGSTTSTNFPTQNPLQAANAGANDAFVAKISGGGAAPRTTSTALACLPSSVQIGQATACTATVTDTGAGSPAAPTGTVSFTTNAPGAFSPAAATCALSPAGPSLASCSLAYVPTAIGAHQISAVYNPDVAHSASSGAAGLTVTGSGGTGGSSPPPPPTTPKPKINKQHRSATFSFSAANATGFECELIAPKKKGHKAPKAHFSPCFSPKTYKHLKPGKYTFKVQASNAAGTGAATSKTFKV